MVWNKGIFCLFKILNFFFDSTLLVQYIYTYVGIEPRNRTKNGPKMRLIFSYPYLLLMRIECMHGWVLSYRRHLNIWCTRTHLVQISTINQPNRRLWYYALKNLQLSYHVGRGFPISKYWAKIWIPFFKSLHNIFDGKCVCLIK